MTIIFVILLLFSIVEAFRLLGTRYGSRARDAGLAGQEENDWRRAMTRSHLSVFCGTGLTLLLIVLVKFGNSLVRSSDSVERLMYTAYRTTRSDWLMENLYFGELLSKVGLALAILVLLGVIGAVVYHHVIANRMLRAGRARLARAAGDIARAEAYERGIDTILPNDMREAIIKLRFMMMIVFGIHFVLLLVIQLLPSQTGVVALRLIGFQFTDALAFAWMLFVFSQVLKGRNWARVWFKISAVATPISAVLLTVFSLVIVAQFPIQFALIAINNVIVFVAGIMFWRVFMDHRMTALFRPGWTPAIDLSEEFRLAISGLRTRWLLIYALHFLISLVVFFAIKREGANAIFVIGMGNPIADVLGILWMLFVFHRALQGQRWAHILFKLSAAVTIIGAPLMTLTSVWALDHYPLLFTLLLVNNTAVFIGGLLSWGVFCTRYWESRKIGVFALVENFSMSLHATMRAFGSLVATMFSGGPAPAAAVVVEAPAPAPAAKVEAVQVEASTPRAGIQTAATPEASAESEERSDET